MTSDEFRRSYALGERNFDRLEFDRINFHSSRYFRCSFKDASFARVQTFDIVFEDCDLTGTKFNASRLKRTSFVRCRLSHCSFYQARLVDSYFDSCSIESASFSEAKIVETQIASCDLREAQFNDALVRRSEIKDGYFARMRVGGASFINCDIASLADAQELDFDGVVTADWLTVCRSLRSTGLEEFLLRGGMPEVFATYIVESARAMDPKLLLSVMRSTFISYGGPDLPFASRLRDALVRNGVRTFLFATDAVAGEPLYGVMYNEIETHERMILVCSETSLCRPGVQHEISLVLAKEARHGAAHYVIPVLVDDFLFGWRPDKPELATILRSRVAADFRQARESDAAFNDGVSRLLRALRR